VTQQQLQLVLRVLVKASGSDFTTAALLLVLLLQRADPGLRAAFLNGPEASLLLVTLVTWGCHPGEWRGRGSPGRLGAASRQRTSEAGVSFMMDCHQGGAGTFMPYTYSHSATLVLLLCYLEPAAPRHLNGKQQPALVCPGAMPVVLTAGDVLGEQHKEC
jgi:hypothetical protein